MDEISRTIRPKPAVLCILDGWGIGAGASDNAIFLGRTPNWDRLLAEYPNSALDASAGEVGLPEGQMGNSEVGHMNLGAGRIVMQDLPRIGAAIANGELATNPALVRLIENLRKSGGACHLMGLLSPGGVHSHQDHMAALTHIVGKAGVKVFIHAFLDGRDTPPRSAKEYMARFCAGLTFANATIATVGGRYYGMDRDKRWDRVEKAYLAMACAMGEPAPDAMAALDASYDHGLGDEFMIPSVIGGYLGMKDGDGLLHANFRADRARELLLALTDEAFSEFPRPHKARFAACAGMASYSRQLDGLFENLFPPHEMNNVLGEIVANLGMKQLRIAETEKYAHVTFFFNGGREETFPGEERILIPSPKVKTYDLQPEMSAVEITDNLVAAIESGKFDFITVNFANGDMVGHTGILAAAIKAVETVDACLGRLEAAVKKAGGVMMIAADHGNCEQMADRATNQPHTAHTLNKTPLILVNGPPCKLRNGRLADVAPTMLWLMGIQKPPEMTGQMLIVNGGANSATAGSR